jgi:hypothetical protein
MSWNYRIVKYWNEDAYGLHEVYYGPDHKENSMTQRPVGFVGDDLEDIRASFDLAREAFERPIFYEPEEWAAFRSKEA